MDLIAAINNSVIRTIRREDRVIERACEKAMQGGVCGVFVHRDRETGRLISAEPHKYVPYGTMFIGWLEPVWPED